MRTTVSIVLEDGSIYRGVAELEKVNEFETADELPIPAAEEAVDFTLPVRPFMKRFASNSAGPKKFTMLLAYMAQGGSNVEIKRAELEAAWSRMSGILGGGFNGAYATRAKDFGWVDSPKNGVYVLLPSWKAALK